MNRFDEFREAVGEAETTLKSGRLGRIEDGRYFTRTAAAAWRRLSWSN